MAARCGRRILLVIATLTVGAPGVEAHMCATVDYKFAGLKPTHALVRSMQQEVSSIWEPYGVRIRTSDSTEVDRCEQVQASFEVQIVQRRPLGRGRPPKVVLGRTRVEARPIVNRPVMIDYSATEQVLRSLRHDELVHAARTANVGALEIGRALGRVLAHEIGHVLLGQAEHERRGLMRQLFPADDLAAFEHRSFGLSPQDVLRLRERERAILDVAATGLASAVLPSVSDRDRPPE